MLKSIAPWEGNGSALLSLLDMQRFYAEKYLMMTRELARVAEVFKDINKPLGDRDKEFLPGFFHQLENDCDDILLKVTAVYIRNMRLTFDHHERTGKDIGEFFKGVSERLTEEASTLLLFHVDKNAAYFGSGLFGKIVEETFPSASYDIDEAGKCLALERGTACVFHLMRVMEVGLRHLADKARTFGISISLPQSNPAWIAVLAPIEREATKPRTDKSSDWLAIEPIYTQVAAHLRTVSIVWRNPTMHVEAKYTTEEAEDIFNAVKVFMRYLASNLQ